MNKLYSNSQNETLYNVLYILETQVSYFHEILSRNNSWTIIKNFFNFWRSHKIQKIPALMTVNLNILFLKNSESLHIIWISKFEKNFKMRLSKRNSVNSYQSVFSIDHYNHKLWIYSNFGLNSSFSQVHKKAMNFIFTSRSVILTAEL